ncbi:unnamed protein product, partial [Ectocarpus sp. 12 AP-2014]
QRSLLAALSSPEVPRIVRVNMSAHGPTLRPNRRMTLALIDHVLRKNGRRDILLYDTIMSIINHSRFANDRYDKTWREIELELANTGNGTNIPDIDYFIQCLYTACRRIQVYEQQ